jgi:hypothetical protein
VARLIPKIVKSTESILKKRKLKKRYADIGFFPINSQIRCHSYFYLLFLEVKIGTSKTVPGKGKATTIEKKTRRN